jgi:hypothetical protein
MNEHRLCSVILNPRTRVKDLSSVSLRQNLYSEDARSGTACRARVKRATEITVGAGLRSASVT